MAEVIKWFDNQGVKIEHLSDKDIMFGILIFIFLSTEQISSFN